MPLGLTMSPSSSIFIIVKEYICTKGAHGRDVEIIHVDNGFISNPFDWKRNWKLNLLTVLLHEGIEHP